jgi:N-acetylglucosamine PTS system EIICBA or EIICB component
MKDILLVNGQRLGRALMLPIAVLPIAGLLLRLGQPDLLNVAVLAQAGNALFSQLPLLFAIGVAVGLAQESHGAAGLAGAIGYLVLTAVLKAIDPAINMGVLAGMLAGVSAGVLYNRYYAVSLPNTLSFFSGRRLVPILTGLLMLLAGVVLGQVWPWVQTGIDTLGHGLLAGGNWGLFAYGFLNRLLLVTGLHHILNSYIWFVMGNFTASNTVVTGDLNRFFAGDPSAGAFMSGFFPIMMFGMPGACLAMYRKANPTRRRAVGGVLLSIGLTALLTGVTEPVEFSFMFLAPLLFLLHALLTGVSMVIMHLLDIRLGFTFSAGLFDFLLSAGKGNHALWLLPVGVAYFFIYYFVFGWAITRFQLKTLGREDESIGQRTESNTQAGQAPLAGVANTPTADDSPVFRYIQALGGHANIQAIDACMTRLRLELKDSSRLDEAALTRLGALGVIKPSATTAQVVIGPTAERLADEMRKMHQSG